MQAGFTEDFRMILLGWLAVLQSLVVLCGCGQQPGNSSTVRSMVNQTETVDRAPDLQGVAKIELQMKPPDTAAPWTHYELNDAVRIGMIRSCLGGIDWSQQGERLEQIQLIRPDIDLTFYGKSDQIVYECQCYWSEDLFVDAPGGRLLDADLKHLRLQLIAVSIKHGAAFAGQVKLDASSDDAIAKSLRIMEVLLSPPEKRDFRQCLEWYENPYSNPLFDGALVDKDWSELPRHKKYDPLHGMSLEDLREHLATVVPGCNPNSGT